MGVHSGYTVLADDNGLHDLHHEKFMGNYGIFGVLDVLHGTHRIKTDPAVDPMKAGIGGG